MVCPPALRARDDPVLIGIARFDIGLAGFEVEPGVGLSAGVAREG